MANDNKQVNIDVQEPLLENSGKKLPITQIEKNDAESNNLHKHKPNDMERKQTKSKLSLQKLCIKFQIIKNYS